MRFGKVCECEDDDDSGTQEQGVWKMSTHDRYTEMVELVHAGRVERGGGRAVGIGQ